MLKNKKNSILCFSLCMIVCLVVFVTLWESEVHASQREELYLGDKGSEVTQVQSKLSQWGYYNGQIDGVFGTGTYRAVREFQSKNNLRVDGVVGERTWTALGYSSGSGQSNYTYLLAKVIAGESRSEPYLGKVAVGAVIMNRIESNAFPNTIPGVVYQKLAFESVSNGYYNRAPDSESLRAARQALAGWDPTYGALYFWNPAKSSSTWIWSREVTMRIGGHVFGV